LTTFVISSCAQSGCEPHDKSTTRRALQSCSTYTHGVEGSLHDVALLGADGGSKGTLAHELHRGRVDLLADRQLAVLDLGPRLGHKRGIVAAAQHQPCDVVKSQRRVGTHFYLGPVLLLLLLLLMLFLLLLLLLLRLVVLGLMLPPARLGGEISAREEDVELLALLGTEQTVVLHHRLLDFVERQTVDLLVHSAAHLFLLQRGQVLTLVVGLELGDVFRAATEQMRLQLQRALARGVE
jgi:hypothetical protein